LLYFLHTEANIHVLVFRAIAIKTPWYRHKNRYEDKWNRIDNPDVNPHSYATLFSTKMPKIYDGEKTASSTNIVGKSDYLHAEN
jgi:hypothetical protein